MKARQTTCSNFFAVVPLIIVIVNVNTLRLSLYLYQPYLNFS